MKTEKEKITAYDIIAICLNLHLVKENIWRDKYGKTYLLTKYGFEEITKQQRTQDFRQMKKQIEELQYEVARQRRLRKEEEDKHLSAKLKLMELEEKMNSRNAA